MGLRVYGLYEMAMETLGEDSTPIESGVTADDQSKTEAYLSLPPEPIEPPRRRTVFEPPPEEPERSSEQPKKGKVSTEEEQGR